MECDDTFESFEYRICTKRFEAYKFLGPLFIGEEEKGRKNLA